VTSPAAGRAGGQEQYAGTPRGVLAGARLTLVGAATGYLPGRPVAACTGLDLTAASPARGRAAAAPTRTRTAPTTVRTTDFHGSTAPVTDIGGTPTDRRPPVNNQVTRFRSSLVRLTAQV
jgi:hypothetical protein